MHSRNSSDVRSPGAPAPRRAGVASGLFAVATACAAVLALGCGSSTDAGSSSDPCGSGYAPTHYTVIGPSGGWVSYGQVASRGDQVLLQVPAGAWQECWEVTVESNWSTPGYPTGFVASQYVAGGSVAISIFRQLPGGGIEYAPDSMYVQLSFPTMYLPAQPQHPLGVFSYDSAAMDWRIDLPDNVDPDFAVVRTSDWRRPWWFGRIDLSAVDFVRYMQPALEDRIGTDTWTRITTLMDSVYNASKSGFNWSCVGANFVEGVFVAIQNIGETQGRAIQNGLSCGSCDAFSPLFWQEFDQYMTLENTGMLLSLMSNAVPGGGQIKEMAGEVVSWLFDLFSSTGFACDYDCFFKHIPKSWWVYMAEYYGGKWVVEQIESIKTDYLHCTAAAARLGPTSVLLAGLVERRPVPVTSRCGTPGFVLGVRGTL